MIHIKRTEDFYKLPEQATPGSSGFDLFAAIPHDVRAVTIVPGQTVLVPCGFHMAMPIGIEAQIRSRSGLALKHGIVVLNSPGTIDSDYRGEVKVILHNHGGSWFSIKRGDRIAQMVFSLVVTKIHPLHTFEIVDELEETDRSAGGFGSTGE